jgi:hypothetical protein
VLFTIWDSFAYGITNDISSKENGTLNTPPVELRAILIPFATPRFSGGTEPITELMFGGPYRAIPTPSKSRLINTAP